MIGQVELNQRLFLKNVLRFRRKCDQHTIIAISNEMEKILIENNAEKVGHTVSVTHGIAMENGREIMDLEMMIQLNKEINIPDGFDFFFEFLLENALKIRIKGSPSQAQKAVEYLANYIKENNLRPNTPIYVVTVKEAKTQFEIDDMITDLYTGIEVI